MSYWPANSLTKLAKLVVCNGVNVQEGQQVIITAPVEAERYVSVLTQQAYERGASLVTTLYQDRYSTVDRLSHSSREYSNVTPSWLYDSLEMAYEKGAARLALTGHPPLPLAAGDAAFQSKISVANSHAFAKVKSFFSDSRTNWNISPFVTEAWAKQVFPGVSTEQAMEQLWQIVFDATSATDVDPMASWVARNEELEARRDHLQGLMIDTLHFWDGQTNVKIGLSPNHRWSGGRSVTRHNIYFNSNLPTYEVFTCPDRNRTDGTVCFSRPFSAMGVLVEGAVVCFEGGRATKVSAKSGLQALESLLKTDEGADRLGEVALVSKASKIFQKKMILYNTLMDENAASHIAFGSSFSKCLQPGVTRAESAANVSNIHVDCMIGNEKMNVEGFCASGETVPIMRDGDFV